MDTMVPRRSMGVTSYRSRCYGQKSILVLAIFVTSANIDDGTTAIKLLELITLEQRPGLEVIWCDNKYHNPALETWMGRKRRLSKDYEKNDIIKRNNVEDREHRH